MKLPEKRAARRLVACLLLFAVGTVNATNARQTTRRRPAATTNAQRRSATRKPENTPVRTPASPSVIESYLREVYAAGEPGAAVLVVRGGRVLHRAAYGLADAETRRPLKPEDVFHVASVTKNFTAAAVLRLVGRGLLSLEDPLGRHLPEVPAAWSRVPLRRLLSHTSGLPDFDASTDETDYTHHDALLARVRQMPPRAAPGEAFDYNNTNYFLLGKILERRAGLPWGRYMEERLFRPLGMHDTRYAAAGHPRLVPGHRQEDGRVVKAPPGARATPYAAGATLSTVDDLARWVSALEAGKVLGPRLRAESLRRTRMNDGTTASYGLGWILADFGPHATAFHSGDINGYSSMLLWIADARLLVVVLSNGQVGSRGRPFFVAQRLAELALGEDWRPRARVTTKQLALLAGRYTNGRGLVYAFEVEDGKLLVRDEGAEARFVLEPFSPADFFGGPGWRFRFEPARGRLLFRPTLGKEERLRRLR